jgi:hypothetical protein
MCVQACGDNNLFSVKVENDLSETVVVGACNGYAPSCSSVAYSLTLSPGVSSSTSQEPDGTFRPMKVSTKSGRTLGCLPFRFDNVTPPTFVVRVSQMVPCGQSLGRKTTEGHDWPDAKY